MRRERPSSIHDGSERPGPIKAPADAQIERRVVPVGRQCPGHGGSGRHHADARDEQVDLVLFDDLEDLPFRVAVPHEDLDRQPLRVLTPDHLIDFLFDPFLHGPILFLKGSQRGYGKLPVLEPEDIVEDMEDEELGAHGLVEVVARAEVEVGGPDPGSAAAFAAAAAQLPVVYPLRSALMRAGREASLAPAGTAFDRAWKGGEELVLTATEYRLLFHLVQNAGWVVSHDQLLQKVWGYEYRDEPHYVRLYINYLRQKLEKDPATPKYILTERGVGYRFVDFKRAREKE